jgi:pyruvate/2-oxoglutarate dehydrogenase complex dihydrolipoamide dehydrogenase (E3) component
VDRFDVVVIGGGGTGSEVAYELVRRSDRRVALVERDRLGGECNHYGCVPTKVMLRAAKVASLARRGDAFGVRVTGPVEVDLRSVQQRARDVVDAMSGEGAAPFERVGVRVFLQEARLTGERRVELADGTVLEAPAIVLATGSEATAPPVPGLAEGPSWTNREAIWEPSEPPAELAILGAGAIGAEFAQIYARFGSRVTLLEALPQVLPGEDEQAAAALVPAFEEDGIKVTTGVAVEAARHDGSRWTIEVADRGSLTADELLVATGRRPVFDGHDLDAAGVELDDDGRPVLTPTLRTTNPNVWVVGDATGELLFTHVGTYEAHVVVDDLLGEPRSRDDRVVPRVTFCDPEVASVGLTERQARERGHDVVVGVSPLTNSERAHIEGETRGLVKLVAERTTGELLGGHVVAAEAGSMIHEVVAIMSLRVTAPAVARAIHAYPTLSESVRAALIGIEDQVG